MAEVETGGDCLARPAGSSALGCYQMTHAALVDAGFKEVGGGWADNPWGIDSDDEFRKNRRAQDAAMLRYTARNWLRLEPCVRDLIGRTVGGVALDQAALLAGAHLLGTTGVVRFVRCGLRARCIPPAIAAGNGGGHNLHASALRRMQAARGLRVLARRPARAPGADSEVDGIRSGRAGSPWRRSRGCGALGTGPGAGGRSPVNNRPKVRPSGQVVDHKM